MAVWYFADGANMEGATLRGRRGVGYARALPVRVPGWRLVFDKPPLIPGGTGSANIVPDERSETLGVAFLMSEADLEHVELTEGVRIGNYAAVEVEAWPLSGGGADLRAWSLSSARRDSAMQPSGRYMALLIESAIDHGLPEAYVAALRAVPTVAESAEASALRPIIDRALRRGGAR